MKRNILMLLVLVGWSQTILAQSNSFSIADDTLTWTASGFYDISNKETINEGSQFIVNRGLSIEWIQNVGDTKYTFNVLSKEGNWSDLSQDGSLTFIVERNNRSGQIKFARANGKTSIQMEFIRNNINVMPFIFNVVEVDKK